MKLPDPLIVSDPKRLGGTPVFAGTRVPVQTFFEYVEGGAPLDAFLEDYPDVGHEHAEAALKLSKADLIAEITSAGVAAC